MNTRTRQPTKMGGVMAEIDMLDALLTDNRKTEGKIKVNAVTGIFLQYRSPMYEGYYTIETMVYPNVKTVVRYPGTIDSGSGNRSIKKEIIDLNLEDWPKVLTSCPLKEIKELPEIVGCPGYDDGSITSLSIFTETDRSDTQFEGPNPPEAIQGLTRALTADVFKE